MANREDERDYPETVAHARSVISKIEGSKKRRFPLFSGLPAPSLLTVCVLGSLFAFFLALAVIISLMVSNSNSIERVPGRLESVATTVEKGARGLPDGTTISGSFSDGGTVSYSDPANGYLRKSQSIDYRGIDHEISGTVGHYSISAAYEDDGEIHYFTYDSLTGETIESSEKGKN